MRLPAFVVKKVPGTFLSEKVPGTKNPEKEKECLRLDTVGQLF